jgi:hypothetical protein
MPKCQGEIGILGSSGAKHQTEGHEGEQNNVAA